MTGIAAHTFINVNTVIEIHEVRQLIHSRPLQRSVRSIAFPHWFEQRGIRPDLRVAVHACLRRRNTGEAGGLNGRMAVATVDPQAGHMMLVTERHRLGLGHARISHIRRTLDLRHRPEQGGYDEYSTKDGGPRERIRTAMENLHEVYEL